MGLLSMLFGRNKLKKPRREEFFSVITAEISLSGRMDLHRTNKAGIVFNPVDSSFFENLDEEIRSLLAVSETSTGTQFKVVDDTYGTRWGSAGRPRLRGPCHHDSHDKRKPLWTTGSRIDCSQRCSAWSTRGKQAYWIYNYKRGNFLPHGADRPTDARQHIRDAVERRYGRGENAR